jgi:hypothetical protein
MPIDISKIVEQTREETIPVASQYDSIWGFYTAKQGVTFNYDETRQSALSAADITINGKFTINGENGAFSQSDLSNSDSSDSDTLLEKYKTIRDMIIQCSNKAPPEEVYKYGTSEDQRCIQLPEKLIDNSSNRIWAIPTSFAMTSLSPQMLEYSASFKEIAKSPCKIAVNNRIIHDASIVISCRKPRISFRNFAFANGGEAYFTGFDNRKYSISGNLSLEDSNSNSNAYSSLGFTNKNSNFIEGISENSICDIAIKKVEENGLTDSWTGKMILNSMNIANNAGTGTTRFSVEGEDCDYGSNSNS